MTARRGGSSGKIQCDVHVKSFNDPESADRRGGHGERTLLYHWFTSRCVNGVSGLGRCEPAREHELSGGLKGRVELGDGRECRLHGGVVLICVARVLDAGLVEDGDHVLGHG